MSSTLSNLFSAVPDALPEEIFATLLQTKALKIERIVSQGHSSPPNFWYDQEQNEWILLVSGEARVEFSGEQEFHLKPGDYLNIPARQKHRVNWTHPHEKTIWLAVFY